MGEYGEYSIKPLSDNIFKAPVTDAFLTPKASAIAVTFA